MADIYGRNNDGTWGVPVVPKSDYEKIAQTIDTVEVVHSLPADAAQHPKTIYIILED